MESYENVKFSPRKLREIRKKCGKTQLGIAEEIGVDLRTYQHWEYGEYAPHPSRFLRLVFALGVTDVRELAEIEGD